MLGIFQARERVEIPAPVESASPDAPQVVETEYSLWGRFSRADSLDAFIRSWLNLQCSMIPHVTGGLVLLGPPDGGPYVPASVWPDSRYNARYLATTAEKALSDRRGLFFRRAPGENGGPDRERYEMAFPIEARGRVHGVVVLDVSPRTGPELQSALRHLHWGSAWLEVQFLRRDFEDEARVRNRLQTVFDLATSALGQKRFDPAAISFVTALAACLKCDRVSLGEMRRGYAHVRAISHSATFKEESNLMRAIRGAMDEAAEQEATTVYPAPEEGKPLILRAHEELARQGGCGSICSVILGDEEGVRSVLTLERSSDAPFDEEAVMICEAAVSIAGPILERQRQEDRWLPVKVYDSLRKQVSSLLGPRQLIWKIAALGAVALLVFLAVAQGDYRVSSKAVIEAKLRRSVAAPFNGYIAETKVRAGDVVRKGQLLGVLDDRELRLERMKYLSHYEQLTKQHHQAMAGRNAAEVQVFSAQIKQAMAELDLVNYKLSRTKLRAPFDGFVILGDLNQLLGSPVERGQILFEIAPLADYRVIVQVDERYVDEVFPGQRGTLVLPAFPNRSLFFTVAKVTPVATASEGRNYFRVEANLEVSPRGLQPGMEGVGKIEIGGRLLVWILTHQAIDWVRLTVWSWLP